VALDGTSVACRLFRGSYRLPLPLFLRFISVFLTTGLLYILCLSPHVHAPHSPFPVRAPLLRRQNLVHEVKHTSVWEQYEVTREIGHGMTGKVYQVRHRLTGEVYALKCECGALCCGLPAELHAPGWAAGKTRRSLHSPR
jgi:hypothetical protein